VLDIGEAQCRLGHVVAPGPWPPMLEQGLEVQAYLKWLQQHQKSYARIPGALYRWLCEILGGTGATIVIASRSAHQS
jgi:hypothetical protein